MKCYVEVDSENYVISWSKEPYSKEAIQVEVTSEFYGILGYTKCINGSIEIDEGKKREILGSNAENETSIEDLKKENEELKTQLEKTKEDVTNTQVALTEVFELIETLV